MTNIPDWNRLKFFFIVAKAKSFSAAQKQLNLSQSAISRQISALETEIKTTLFHRHPRGLVLTDQGDLLYQTAKDIYKQIHEAEALLIAGNNTAIGNIKLTTTRSFGSMWLSKRLITFCKQHPDIHIELLIDDRVLNLSMREADFAIRMWKPFSNDVIAKKFIKLNCHYYASKAYLEQYGMPEKIDDLNDHRLLEYINSSALMREKLNHHLYYESKFRRKRKVFYSSSSLKTICDGVEGGLGIATLPDYMTVERIDLVKIFPDFHENFFDTYIAYPHELEKTKRVQLLEAYLFECGAQWCY